MSEQGRLDFGALEPVDPQLERDRHARLLATDPRRNVALEASAGTGKTRVLVDRYVRLVSEAGVHPRNILAITFTRKAAAEMRQRVLDTLRTRHREGALAGAAWQRIRDAFPEIAISTIDAFCLQLLREFPLEAGVDPGFDLADETETPRLVGATLDRALRIGRGLAVDDPDVALVFVELGEFRLRQGLTALLDRRLVAWDALTGFLRGRALHVDEACRHLHQALAAALEAGGGPTIFLGSGPVVPGFDLIAHDVRALTAGDRLPAARLRAIADRLTGYVLTKDGEPRKRLTQRRDDFGSAADYDRHKNAVVAVGPPVASAMETFRRELNLVLARGVSRLFAVARDEYARVLGKHGVLDFSDVLERSLALVEQRDEFSRSRFKLESRYQHVLVDEFQDTSRAQWRLVKELIRAWAEGDSVGDGAVPPSIFIVGDRKQSIYAFRDAEVAVLEAAGRYIDALRPDSPARAAITRSHRSVRQLLAFVNDLFAEVPKVEGRADAFRYGEDDRFPLATDAGEGEDPLGLVLSATETQQADAVAEEIARLLASGAEVRDRLTGVRRAIEPGDIAVLFRTREGHRLFEAALARRRVPFYVYKGLGFFDADEIKDVLALLAWLAQPRSDLRAAAFLRSRFVRLSDPALKLLAPRLADALVARDVHATGALDDHDSQRLVLARSAACAWLPLVDRLPPAELLDRALAESAYAAELRGPGLAQARENLKKLRTLVRRMQNRGYQTLERLVDYFSQLVAGGDESNAIIDAVDAVNLMTTHAAKGLEFPVVFVVNLTKGSGGAKSPIRIVPAPFSEDELDGVAAVGIGDHESEADRDASTKDLEETKRLLYVACTRARDRLYLSAALKDGRFSPQTGSLARVMPPSLQTALGTASGEYVSWTSQCGTHRLRVVPPSGDTPRAFTPHQEVLRVDDDLRRLAADGPVVLFASADLGAPGAADAESGSTRAIGSFVHRALGEVLRWPAPVDDARLDRFLTRASDAELDVEALARASGWVRALANRPELRAVLEGGVLAFEVPYSRLDADSRVWRGAIDCLVVNAAQVTVLEFKSGRPQASHVAQLDHYLAAARALYPDHAVDGRLVYASE